MHIHRQTSEGLQSVKAKEFYRYAASNIITLCYYKTRFDKLTRQQDSCTTLAQVSDEEFDWCVQGAHTAASGTQNKIRRK